MKISELYDREFIPDNAPRNRAISVLCINPFSPSFLKKFYLTTKTLNNVTQSIELAQLMTEENAKKAIKNPLYKRLGILKIVYL